jgi:hypothetical protein
MLKKIFNPGVLCLVLCLTFLLVGLWPFEFFPENKVDWVGDPIGLRFRGDSEDDRREAGGLAFTPYPLIGSGRSSSFSIEIKLRCNREPRGSVPGILVFCDEEKTPSLFVGQWKSCLLVRRFNKEIRNGKKWKEASICGALTEGATRLITLVSNGSESVFYVDGKPVKRFPRLSLMPEPGSLAGHYLLLGNTPESTNGWMGDILGIALYDRSLTDEEVLKSYHSWGRNEDGLSRQREGLFLHYGFRKISGEKVEDYSGRGNDLLIPSHARFKSKVLAPVEIAAVSMSGLVQDVLINIIGFIPLGFFLSIFLAGRTKLAVPIIAAAATLAGAAISLFIELAQSQIPVRTSSTGDLISNALGACLGGLFFVILLSQKDFLAHKESNHGR